MFAKIALAGATAAAIVGVGTAAIAASGPSSTAGSGSTGSTPSSSQHGSGAQKSKQDHKGKHSLQRALRRGVHGSIVTKGKDGYVTHTAVRGTVTSVSSTALTVKAADGFTQTYTVGKSTRVRERSADGKKATKGTLSQVKTGDKVGVIGTAADKAGARPTARIVVDGLKK